MLNLDFYSYQTKQLFEKSLVKAFASFYSYFINTSYGPLLSAVCIHSLLHSALLDTTYNAYHPSIKAYITCAIFSYPRLASSSRVIENSVLCLVVSIVLIISRDTQRYVKCTCGKFPEGISPPFFSIHGLFFLCLVRTMQYTIQGIALHWILELIKAFPVASLCLYFVFCICQLT